MIHHAAHLCNGALYVLPVHLEHADHEGAPVSRADSPDQAEALIHALCAGGGREHRAFWFADAPTLDRFLLWLYSERGDPLERPRAPGKLPTFPAIHWSSSSRSPTQATHGRAHFRALSSHLSLSSEKLSPDRPAESGPALTLLRDETPPNEPQTALRTVYEIAAAIVSLARLWSALGVELAATPGGAAVQLVQAHAVGARWTWRAWAREDWTHRDRAGQEQRGALAHLDFLRAAHYGGRCEILPVPLGAALRDSRLVTPGAPPEDGAGLYFCDGAELPAAASRWRLEPRRLPPGWSLYHIDIRSAYPWAMRRPMPHLWGPCSDRLRLDQPGAADVTVAWTGPAAPILPVRVAAEDAWAPTLYWPSGPGWIVRSIWPTSALWYALQAGGIEIQAVHRATSYAHQSPYLAPVADALIAARRIAPSGPLADALKAAGRQVYGKLAQGRDGTELLDSDELRARVEAPDSTVRAVLGRWGRLALVSTVAHDYPAHVSPLAAAEITTAVHVRLWRAEQQIRSGGGIPIYCDTDAWFYAAPRPLVPTGPQIGDWTEKARPPWLAIWSAKRYAAPHARAAAGVPLEAQEQLFALGWATVPASEGIAARLDPRAGIVRRFTL